MKKYNHYLLFFLIMSEAAILWASPYRSLAPESAPVYIKPFGAAPTGHYSVKTLSQKLIRKENISWVFVKDLDSGHMGWTPRNQLLSPLHFSTKARLLSKTPVFRTQKDRSPTSELMPKNEVTVPLVAIESDWARIELNNELVWVHTSYLLPVHRDPGYFFTKVQTPLRASPQTKSQFLATLKAGEKLTPLNVNKNWVTVSVNGKKGFVPLRSIVHRIHAASKVKTDDGLVPAEPDMILQKVYAVYVDPLWLGTGVNTISLYSEPATSGGEVARIPPWTSLQQQETLVQEWALSQVDKVGPVWWLIENTKTSNVQWKELSKENFKHIIHNPLFPSLRVGVADGLYRSTDGKNWAPIHGIKNPDPAVTFSKDGVLFVDDKMSVDNGETLNSFIFWEAVLYKLRMENLGIAQSLKILNIQTLDHTSQKLIYDLDVGGSRPVRLQTLDRGQTWSILR